LINFIINNIQLVKIFIPMALLIAMMVIVIFIICGDKYSKYSIIIGMVCSSILLALGIATSVIQYIIIHYFN